MLWEIYIIGSQEKNLDQNRDSNLGPPDCWPGALPLQHAYKASILYKYYDIYFHVIFTVDFILTIELNLLFKLQLNSATQLILRIRRWFDPRMGRVRV